MKTLKNQISRPSVWFYFCQLKARFPDPASFSEKALWAFLKDCVWFANLLACSGPPVELKAQKLSARDFWQYVKKHNWALTLLEKLKSRGETNLQGLKKTLPPSFFKTSPRPNWLKLQQAWDFFLWQNAGEELKVLKIRDKQPTSAGQAPVKIRNLALRPEIAESLQHYCLEHNTTLPQIFHRIVEYQKIGTEARALGISEGIFEELLKQFDGLWIGSDALRQIETFCKQRNCLMSEFFCQAATNDIATQAKRIGILPIIYARLLNFFQSASKSNLTRV
ncbi:hypothetical protein C4546_04800 [Candidatus Parcubacteria bacterium]|nr:MAG: hypothetical protein C4546_04800 [Candidatus Parcubacteria bacterium]